ncbi:MAG TPA: nitrous oxide reductase accessory protein NosL [Sandaracinaceae bacterium]
MRTLASLSLVLVLALALSAAGCAEGEAEAQSRCALCGMRVDPRSGWRAGGRSARGELVFDAPKCMFRMHHREGLRDLWVIEYYSQERRPARELYYVIGTDLEGPMGRDLVPVAGRENAERLMRDHRGERVLSFDEVTAAVIDELFRPRRR